jgi:hypothetical protein
VLLHVRRGYGEFNVIKMRKKNRKNVYNFGETLPLRRLMITKEEEKIERRNGADIELYELLGKFTFLIEVIVS